MSKHPLNMEYYTNNRTYEGVVGILKLNSKQLVMATTIVTLTLLLLVNNSEYKRYRTLNQMDISALNNNIVTLESTKTKIQKSLEKTILELQLENGNLIQHLQVLEDQRTRLAASLGIKKIAYLRPHDSIDYLSLQYGTKFQPSIGYMGSIKTFDFDSKAYTEVKVLDTKGEWSKISIEAFIPKWYVVDKQMNDFKQEDIMHSINNITMYVKEKCSMKLAPDKNSFTQLDLEKGKAVYVTKEYGDWYFIELQQTTKNTDFTQGWVKKSQIGKPNKVEPLEAIIKSGTLVMEYYDTEESEERILNSDIPVYIVKEKNIGGFVYGKVTDNWGFWINKKDIDFNYKPKKNVSRNP